MIACELGPAGESERGVTAVQVKAGSTAGKGDKRDEWGRSGRRKGFVDMLIPESEFIALSRRDYAFLAQDALPGTAHHEAVTKFLSKRQRIK